MILMIFNIFLCRMKILSVAYPVAGSVTHHAHTSYHLGLAQNHSTYEFTAHSLVPSTSLFAANGKHIPYALNDDDDELDDNDSDGDDDDHRHLCHCHHDYHNSHHHRHNHHS